MLRAFAGRSESQSRRCDSLETIFQFKKRTMDKGAVEAPEKSSFGNSLDKRFMTSTRASEERDRKVSNCIYSINRPGRLLNFWTLRVGAYSRWALFEAGCLLNFHHFQQVKYVYFATKQ